MKNDAPSPIARARIPLLCTIIALVFIRPAPAQEVLVRADSLIAVGEYAAARTLIDERYQGSISATGLGPADQARLLLLRGRLNPDPTAAESDYLALALGHPGAPEAPRALLYLGQGLFARGDYLRASSYLERLSRDYPTSRHRPTALLWLARVQFAAGRPNEACQTARAILSLRVGSTLTGPARSIEGLACALAGSITDQPYRAIEEEVTPAPQQATTSQSGSYAIQLGAFRRQEGADTIARRLRQAGFEPRIVILPGSTLKHVRIGNFETAEAANEVVRSLRRQGFDAVLVTDTTSERPDP